MPICLMFSCSRDHPCREVGTMILLPFITITSITAITSQNSPYSWISSWTSVLSDGHLQNWSVYLIDPQLVLHA